MGRPIYRFAFVAIALAFGNDAEAQEMPAARKADLACEAKIVDKLGAGADARLVDGTRQHDKNQFTACFSARNARGAHRMVIGTCDYSPAGEIVGEVVVLDSSVANDLCGRRVRGR